MYLQFFRFSYIFVGTVLALCYWGLHWISSALRIKHLKNHVRVRLRDFDFMFIFSYLVIFNALIGGVPIKRKPVDMFEQTLW